MILPYFVLCLEMGWFSGLNMNVCITYKHGQSYLLAHWLRVPQGSWDLGPIGPWASHVVKSWRVPSAATVPQVPSVPILQHTWMCTHPVSAFLGKRVVWMKHLPTIYFICLAGFSWEITRKDSNEGWAVSQRSCLGRLHRPCRSQVKPSWLKQWSSLVFILILHLQYFYYITSCETTSFLIYQMLVPFLLIIWTKLPRKNDWNTIRSHREEEKSNWNVLRT